VPVSASVTSFSVGDQLLEVGRGGRTQDPLRHLGLLLGVGGAGQGVAQRRLQAIGVERVGHHRPGVGALDHAEEVVGRQRAVDHGDARLLRAVERQAGQEIDALLARGDDHPGAARQPEGRLRAHLDGLGAHVAHRIEDAAEPLGIEIEAEHLRSHATSPVVGAWRGSGARGGSRTCTVAPWPGSEVRSRLPP
jgi:hypothetical protein